MSWADIIQFGRIISDVVRGMKVTQCIAVGHIATFRAQYNSISGIISHSLLFLTSDVAK